MPSIHDGYSVHVWSEIGVIFLLFALGLEFSFKKILKMGAANHCRLVVSPSLEKQSDKMTKTFTKP